MRGSNRAGPDDASLNAQSRQGGLISGSNPSLNEYRRPKGVPPRVQGTIVTHCRKCGYQMGNIGTTICPECGTNNDPEAHTLKKPKNAAGLRRCPTCEYDLSGLKGPHCPECGTVLTARGMARVRGEQQVRAYWRKLWISSGCLLVALVLMNAGLVLVGKVPVLSVLLMTVMGCLTLCGVVCFFGVFTRVGLSETWTGTLIKSLLIGGVMVLTSYTGVLLLSAMGGAGLLILLPFFLQFIVALWLLTWLMDYDTDEAMWIAGLSFVVIVVLRITIALVF